MTRGGIERTGPRLVRHAVSLLDDVEGGPEIVGGDVGRNRAPGLGPDGGELADEPDRRAQPVLALLEPRLEPPVDALASSAVVLHLLAGHRADLGVGEVLHRRRQRAGRKAVVGVAEHDDRRRRLGEAPVERLGLAEAVRAGQRPGAGPPAASAVSGSPSATTRMSSAPGYPLARRSSILAAITPASR